MQVELYKPQDKDPQTPHLQDELYIVLNGTGTFSKAGIVQPFKTGMSSSWRLMSSIALSPLPTTSKPG